MRAFLPTLAFFLGVAAGCGGEPRAEPTWETHTTAPDDGEDEPGGQGEDEAAEEPTAEDPAEP